jgi:diguanylate cyclase (GGDEF)-like protein
MSSAMPRPHDGLTTAPRVLVVDSDRASLAQLVELGKQELLAVVAVATPAEAIEQARRARFDAAIVDASLGPDALALASRLRALPGNARLPLAFLSTDGGIEHRIAAAHAGASLFLRKPVDAYSFGTAVEQMLALGRDDRPRVLVVDDDADFVECVAAVLDRQGIDTRGLSDPTNLLDVLEDVRPDLVLLDAMLPHVSGFDLARMIRATPEWRDLPIVFLTGRADVESRVAAFEAGGDDYLAKPLVAEELVARVRVRLDRRRLLREMTEKDSLTKLLSRRALLDALASRISEARRHGRRLALALIDVDRFKAINDVYGHIVGDHVLAALGRLLAERFRLEDVRGRWGGEEFVIVFPGERADTAAGVLGRVLEEFRRIPFPSEHGERFFVTFSAGVASLPEDGSSVDALVRAADLRLYEAKHTGRNRVVAI